MLDKKPNKVIRKKNYGGTMPIIISLAGIIVLSALIAGVWQTLYLKSAAEPPFEPGTVIAGSSSDVSSSEIPEPSSEPEPVAKTYDYSSPVPIGERVRSDYFNDAAFVGDSITTGIEGYSILPDTNVVAAIGVNLSNVQSAAVFEVKAGEKITFLDALGRIGPKKIYVMLGANGLAFLSSEETVNLYSQFVDKIKAQHPESIIYVQSILPIDEALFKANYQGELTNSKIDETNMQLQKMAEEKQVYYIDISPIFKNENGGLISEASTDGLHFKSDYYTKWIDYLKEHTVQN